MLFEVWITYLENSESLAVFAKYPLLNDPSNDSDGTLTYFAFAFFLDFFDPLPPPIRNTFSRLAHGASITIEKKNATTQDITYHAKQ